jgi:putative ABC transport system permease protein
MRFWESLRVAASGLLSNRLRSILTMLGIVIGVAAVLALVSFGQGYQRFVTSQFQRLGANLLTIFEGSPAGPDANVAKTSPLTMGDAEALADPSKVPGVAAVAPVYEVSATVVYGGNSLSMQVTGVTTAWQKARDWDVDSGRFLDETDLSSAARVVVLGATTVKKLFTDGSDPLGQQIRIDAVPFEVIGVLASKGGFGNADQVLIAPLTTVQIRLPGDSIRTTSGEYTLSSIYVKAASEKEMTSVKAQIEQVLMQRHGITNTSDEDFRILSQEQILTSVNNTTSLLTLFLGVIAGISLFVGGIGVMNIMLVSVTERTREIGLRKAVGARYLDLMAQFLIESVVLSVGGGLLGILAGVLVTTIAGKVVSSLTFTITAPAVLLATGVSTAIGVFFGLYPAGRAASLNPIEALRYE